LESDSGSIDGHYFVL